MPEFRHDGLSFYFLDRGVGVPFVFQHGLGGEAQRVFDLIGELPGFRLLGMDCRGHGKTVPLGSPEKLAFNYFADDLTALLDHLKVKKAIVGGTSMGAGIALNCSLRFPERVLGLVLLRPAWLDCPTKENLRIFSSVAKLLREHGPEVGAERFKGSDPYAALLKESSDAASSALEFFLQPRAMETVAKLERIPQDAPNWDRAEWRKLDLPTLVLANRSDPIHPFEFGTILSEEIPRAEFVELTPKSVNLAQYTADLRRSLASFLKTHFGNQLTFNSTATQSSA